MEIHDSIDHLTDGGAPNRVPGEAFASGLVWLVFRGEHGLSRISSRQNLRNPLVMPIKPETLHLPLSCRQDDVRVQPKDFGRKTHETEKS